MWIPHRSCLRLPPSSGKEIDGWFLILYMSHRISDLKLTTVGTNGGLILRSKRSSQAMCLKNACFFTSSASRSLEPKRRSGFLRKSYKNKEQIMRKGRQDKEQGQTLALRTISVRTENDVTSFSYSTSPSRMDDLESGRLSCEFERRMLWEKSSRALSH